MKLYEIQPLLQDMGRNQAHIDKFRFQYNPFSVKTKPFCKKLFVQTENKIFSDSEILNFRLIKIISFSKNSF